MDLRSRKKLLSRIRREIKEYGRQKMFSGMSMFDEETERHDTEAAEHLEKAMTLVRRALDL